MIAYLEHVEEQGELDLEAATEFLVLIASLLELKSRLLLPAAEEEEPALGPEEAADELLARMLEYRRYRDAAAHLARAVRRRPPLPLPLRAAAARAAPGRARRRPPRLRARLARRLDRRPAAEPAATRPSHIRPTVSLERRLRVLRELLASRGRSTSTRRSAIEDRLTQAVTLFALLEMHKRGEATWSQRETFGRITIEAA